MADMSRFEKAFDKVNKRMEEVLEASARRAEGEVRSRVQHPALHFRRETPPVRFRSRSHADTTRLPLLLSLSLSLFSLSLCFSTSLGAPQISSIERARINVTLAKALNVVYAMHLEVQGVSADDHPVRGELRRMERSLEMVEERLRIGRGTRTSEDAAVGVAAKALDESGTKSGKGRKRKKTRPEGV